MILDNGKILDIVKLLVILHDKTCNQKIAATAAIVAAEKGTKFGITQADVDAVLDMTGREILDVFLETPLRNLLADPEEDKVNNE
jgi:hypothetical protein